MCGLLPLPAVHSNAPPPPQVNQLFHDSRVAHGVVFTEEEEGWRRNRAVVENLDAVLVEVCRVGLEKPEVEHGGVFDEAF